MPVSAMIRYSAVSAKPGTDRMSNAEPTMPCAANAVRVSADEIVGAKAPEPVVEKFSDGPADSQLRGQCKA